MLIRASRSCAPEEPLLRELPSPDQRFYWSPHMDVCIHPVHLNQAGETAGPVCHLLSAVHGNLHRMSSLVSSLLQKLSVQMLTRTRSVSQAGGAGSMFHEPGTAPNLGWGFMFGITAILGAWGAGTLGQSDWTRYANRRFAPTLSQLVAAPLTIAITAIIGIIVASASRDVLGGDIEWNPIYLLAAVQEHYHSSPHVRAGVFFASMGCAASQLSVLASVSFCPSIHFN